MAQIQEPIVLANWKFAETQNHNRSKKWYIVASIIAFTALFFSMYIGNFLFAAIIIMVSFIYAFSSLSQPLQVHFYITEEGLHLGRRFYTYRELDSFWVLYEPRNGLQNIFFRYKSDMRPILSVPLMEQSPVDIRRILLDYLPEDLEIDDEPFSDVLERVLKL